MDRRVIGGLIGESIGGFEPDVGIVLDALNLGAGASIQGRTRQLVTVAGRPKRDNDVRVAIAAMRLLAEEGVIELCIASGDSDFRALAFEARRRHALFSVATFEGRGAAALCTVADRWIELDEQFVGHAEGESGALTTSTRFKRVESESGRRDWPENKRIDQENGKQWRSTT